MVIEEAEFGIQDRAESEVDGFRIPKKKQLGESILHAGQPVDADGSAGRVTPELDELLNGKDAGKVFHAEAILGMTAFQLRVSGGVSGDPSDMGNSDDIAVQICFQDSCATRGRWVMTYHFTIWVSPTGCRHSVISRYDIGVIGSCLDLSALL